MAGYAVGVWGAGGSLDHVHMPSGVEWQELMCNKLTGGATAEESSCKTALLEVCSMTAWKSLCNTDNCCRTEPLCSASLVAPFPLPKFPAKYNVSRQIGAAT